MNKIMKNTSLFLIFISFFSFYNYAQESNDSDIYGFYMKNGDKKVHLSEISCYSFDELSIVFPNLPEMRGYDFIGILIYHYDARGWSQGFTEISYTRDIFNAKFPNQSVEVVFFKKGKQKHDLRNGEMTRGSLNYSPTKKLEGHTMKFQVYGYSITGHYNGSTTYSDRYYIYESEALPMTNRERRSNATLPFAGVVGKSLDVDLSIPCE